MKESRLRSVVKSLTWRLISTVNAFLITYVFVGNVGVALGTSLAANVTGLVLYYFHERTWTGIKWKAN